MKGKEGEMEGKEGVEDGSGREVVREGDGGEE